MKHRNMRNKLWGNHTMGYNTAKKKKKKLRMDYTICNNTSDSCKHSAHQFIKRNKLRQR